MSPSSGSADPFADVDWALVWERATLIARVRVRPQEVDDLVTMGIERILSGQAPWDPTHPRPLPAYVVAVGYNALREQWRKANRPHDPVFVARFGASLEETAEKSPEDAVLDAELSHRKQRLFERLERAFDDDPDADAVIACETAGVHEPAAQATRTGLPIEAVRNARKRITRRAYALFAEDDKEWPS